MTDCPKGHPQPLTARFCSICGSRMTTMSDIEQKPTTRAGNGFAITSLVLGIFGLLGLIFIFSVPAIIFGGVALARANSGRGSGRGMAIAGLILGIIGTLLSLLLIVVLVMLQVGGFDWTSLSPDLFQVSR
jgi:hypothetical protein